MYQGFGPMGCFEDFIEFREQVEKTKTKKDLPEKKVAGIETESDEPKDVQ